jgi:hypothetical protein
MSVSKQELRDALYRISGDNAEAIRENLQLHDAKGTKYGEMVGVTTHCVIARYLKQTFCTEDEIHWMSVTLCVEPPSGENEDYYSLYDLGFCHDEVTAFGAFTSAFDRGEYPELIKESASG